MDLVIALLVLALVAGIVALAWPVPLDHQKSTVVDNSADIRISANNDKLTNLEKDGVRKKVAEKATVMRSLGLRAWNAGYDKYGDHDIGPFADEVDEFCQKFFAGTYRKYPDELVNFAGHEIYNLFNTLLVQDAQNIPVDALAFEGWCAEQIAQQGWSTQLTKGSGDQGVDIVATKGVITVAIQCKRFQNPVGNKAVQEAHTGKQHYTTNKACVIATPSFTKSAHELASSTGVVLLVAEDIGGFSDRLLSQ